VLHHSSSINNSASGVQVLEGRGSRETTGSGICACACACNDSSCWCWAFLLVCWSCDGILIGCTTAATDGTDGTDGGTLDGIDGILGGGIMIVEEKEILDCTEGGIMILDWCGIDVIGDTSSCIAVILSGSGKGNGDSNGEEDEDEEGSGIGMGVDNSAEYME